ncbi:hypothetical protein D3C86_2102480 [compost metagenome]
MAARDDAALFVASDGQLHAAKLEAALRLVRGTQLELCVSDLELAQAILVK